MYRFIGGLLAVAVVLSAAPVKAQEVKAEGSLNDIPVVNAADWRTSKGGITWSVPVLVRDEFDGDYLAVFDRNFKSNSFTGEEVGVVSNWSRHYLRLYSYAVLNKCGFLVCRKLTSDRETTNVSVKAGKKVFRLSGKNGNFKIDEELAYALKMAPAGEAKIRFQHEGSGVSVVNDIGSGTVQAWKTVYKDAAVPKCVSETASGCQDQP
jgi:hypothetical protein